MDLGDVRMRRDKIKEWKAERSGGKGYREGMIKHGGERREKKREC